MQALSIKNSVSEVLPLVRKNPTAQSIVTFLAERARHRTDTDLKRLKYDMYHAGFFVDDRDYSAFWEDLSKESQVGRLTRATTIDEPVMKGDKPVMKDRKPLVRKVHKPAKFHWNFSCKAFGQEMIQCMKAAGIDPQTHNVSLARLEGRKPRMASSPKAKSEQGEVSVAMRVSVGNVKLFVPYGLTKEDAEKISQTLLEMAK